MTETVMPPEMLAGLKVCVSMGASFNWTHDRLVLA